VRWIVLIFELNFFLRLLVILRKYCPIILCDRDVIEIALKNYNRLYPFGSKIYFVIMTKSRR